MDHVATAAARPPQRTRVLLVNALEKLPGENFRDQRYTFLYEMLKPHADVIWFSSDFHHWSRSRRTPQMLPPQDRANVRLIRTLAYQRNVSLRRLVSYFALSVATLWNLLRLEHKPHAIVCMGPAEQMFFVTLYGRLAGVPVLIDVIDPWPDVYLKGFPPRWRWLGHIVMAPYFLLSALTFALSTRVTAVSDTYLEWARQRGRRNDRAAFQRYYLGARNDQFDVGSVPEAQDPLVCLFAGQFGFSYDVELILDAAEQLQRAGRRDIRFILCGAGDKQEEVSRRARQLSNVELHGWLSPAELNAVGARSHVGLCCYRVTATQSIPTKIFDYFSMGLYVVSSLAGEAGAMLREHEIGRSYRAGDVEDFVRCLEGVRREVPLSRAGRAAIRAKFDDQFSSLVIYERMIEETILPLARSGAPRE